MPRALVLSLLLPLLGPATASAQLCAGDPSFAVAPLHLVAHAFFNDNTEAYNLGLMLGGARGFGGIDVGMTTFSIFNGDSFTAGASAGYQVPLGDQGKAQLCPMVTFGIVRGPKDLDLSGTDYSETDFSFKLAAGFVAVAKGDVQVVPTASLAFANALPRLTDSLGNSNTTSESFGIIGVGVAVMFGQQVRVGPSVLIPFGLRGAATTYGFRFVFSLAAGR